MSINDWFRGILRRKSSPSRQIIAVQKLGQPVTTPKDFGGYSKEGYQKNVIAFRAVLGLSRGVAGLHWLLYEKRKGGKDKEILDHPLLDLIKRPNPMQGRAAFFEALTAFLAISGNTYIEGVGSSDKNPVGGKNPPKELWVPRPDRIRVIPGSRGLPQAFEYKLGSQKKVYQVDQIKGTSPILHLKTFHPTNDWYGMSPIEAASLSVDQHNEAGIWNLSLLQNKATPSGALVYGGNDKNPSGKLDTEQYDRLEKKLQEKMGPQNAGRPLLLEGGLDWKAMGFSPSDMDWINSKNTSAREIALAFSYPPVLLGIPGDSTYNNQQEARLALYEEGILPFAYLIRDELNNWLTPIFDDKYYLDIDLDRIDALATKREAVWTKVQNSNFLTLNEKRQAVGYDPVEGGDTLFVDAGKLPLELASDPEFGLISDNLTNEDEEAEPEDDEKSFEYKAAETRFEDYVRRFTENYVGLRITRLKDATRLRVLEAVRNAQVEFLEEGSTITELSKAIQKNVGEVYQKISDTRARAIARTETTVAANEGSRAAAKSLGIPNLKKEWLSGEDSRTRESHSNMNGVRVGMDEKFIVKGVEGNVPMDGPGDPSAPAAEVINCRCILVYDDEGKSFNLSSSAAKKRQWLKTIRQRNSFERKFSAQMAGYFKSECDEMINALDGIQDSRIAERVVDSVLAQQSEKMEAIYRSNIESIVRRFGRDVLRLRT